jgi:thioredoxin:protein disulfide reductase
MRQMCKWIIGIALLCPPFAQAQADFLSPDQAFQLTVTQESQVLVRLDWKISDGYYLYRKQFKVEAEPAGSVENVSLPKGVLKTDPYFGQSEVYTHRLTVHVKAPKAQVLTLHWQGCAEAGLCYPPQTRRVKLAAILPNATPLLAAPATVAIHQPRMLAEDQALAARLAQAAFGWMLLVFFGLGLLLTFTPCVLPMLPILSSLVIGNNTRRGFLLSLGFVLPMAFSYAALGALSAALGTPLQAALQNPWILGGFALIFAGLALALFGCYELQLPAFLSARLNQASQKQRGGTFGGAAAMGVLSALLVGPCLTPPLAGVLLYIGETGSVLKGALALLAMGLGMGLPLLLVGTLGARWLPRCGPWMRWIQGFFGFVLLGTAVWLLSRILSPVLTLGLWGAWVLATALSMWLSAPMLRTEIWQWLARYLALLLGLWGSAMILGAASGASNPFQPLAMRTSRVLSSSTAAEANDRFMTRFKTVHSLPELNTQLAQAQLRHQWSLVDFYADWCVACKVIEDQVFANPEVQQALAGIQLLRPDVTPYGAASRALLSTFQVPGPPTLLWIGPDGRERRAARIIGTLSAQDFLARLKQAQREE